MLPHLCIILSLMLLTFFVTDRFNTAMAFINHPMTKRLLVIYLLCEAFCLFLLLLRKKVRRSAAGLSLSIASILLVGIVAILLALDYALPARLLLTLDIVKVTIALVAVSGILSSLVLIRLERRAFARAAAKAEENRVTE